MADATVKYADMPHINVVSSAACHDVDQLRLRLFILCCIAYLICFKYITTLLPFL